jgi:hypothetical protein
MIYVESALQQLRESFDKLSLTYEMGDLDEKGVEINIVKSNLTIRTWFNVEKQLFGFDMLQGGCKTYGDFNEFEKYLVTYLQIYTEFLPSAKVIADSFEKSMGVNSVYDNFQGNKQTGYVAMFKIFGQDNDDKSILISKIPEGYSARLVQYIEGNTKYRIISEYKYETDEVNNLSIIPTVYSYMDELANRYDEDDTVDIERIGSDEFLFKINDLEIKATVSFMYKNVNYTITDISGFAIEGNKSEYVPYNDAYKLEDLYLYCKEIYDDLSYTKQLEDEVAQAQNQDLPSEDFEKIEEPEQEVAEEDMDSEGDEDDYQDNELNEVDDDITEDIETEQSTPVEDTKIEEVETLEPVEDFSIKTIVGSDRTIRSIQFMTDSDIYTMSVEKAKQLGIPVERIDERASCTKKRGILLTEDEIARHSFSKDISNDEDMCNQLFNSIFA